MPQHRRLFDDTHATHPIPLAPYVLHDAGDVFHVQVGVHPARHGQPHQFQRRMDVGACFGITPAIAVPTSTVRTPPSMYT